MAHQLHLALRHCWLHDRGWYHHCPAAGAPDTSMWARDKLLGGISALLQNMRWSELEDQAIYQRFAIGPCVCVCVDGWCNLILSITAGMLP